MHLQSQQFMCVQVVRRRPQQHGSILGLLAVPFFCTALSIGALVTFFVQRWQDLPHLDASVVLACVLCALNALPCLLFAVLWLLPSDRRLVQMVHAVAAFGSLCLLLLAAVVLWI